MKPACWEACFLYPCPTVEHSNNCLLLLCRLFLKPSGHYTKILELKSYTNEIKYRSYQTIIPIQESWIDGNICNIPFDITTALMTDKPYIFYVLPCSVIGHQVRYDYDLSTSTVAIASIEFGAQLIAGNNVRFGIFIAGI